MTIKDLKEKIKFLDDNMKIGGMGYFGEFLECFEADTKTVSKTSRSDDKEEIFCISIESPGDEPD